MYLSTRHEILYKWDRNLNICVSVTTGCPEEIFFWKFWKMYKNTRNKIPDTENFRSSHRRCSVKKGVLRNPAKFTAKYLCQSLFFIKVAGLRLATLLKKETLAQVFSCEFCEISKNIFFTELLWTTTSEIYCPYLFYDQNLGVNCYAMFLTSNASLGH